MKATRKPLTKETYPMTNSTAFALRMISIPVVAGLLAALWCDSASAAESKPVSYRTANPGALVAKLPATIHGSCKITERLETDKDGNQRIVRHTVCQGK